MQNYKDKLIEVVEEYWKKDLPIPKERDVELDLKTDLINDVVGIRRSGKTYLMFLTVKKLDKEATIYLNFENRRLFPLTEKYFDALIEYIYAKELLKKFDKIYLFFDEVQRIKNWERYVRSFYDEFKGKIKIFVSGSTSKLTEPRLSYLLSGRHLTTEVYPLSFREFLRFRDFGIPEFFVEEDRARLKEMLREYIEFGGFPEIVLSDRKDEIIETLMLDIINRDVLPRIGKRKEIVEELVYFLCSNSGKLLSFNKIAKLFARTSVVTIQKFFNIFKEVFLFFDLLVCSPSVKAQLLHPRKIFCIDTGFVNHFGFRFSEDRGRLMENLVAVELKRRASKRPGLRIFYWKEYGKRDGEEVDFVLREGSKVRQLIQVTYASTIEEVRRKEIAALLKASKELRCGSLLIITWDLEDEIKVGSKNIKLSPLWKWLLSSGP